MGGGLTSPIQHVGEAEGVIHSHVRWGSVTTHLAQLRFYWTHATFYNSEVKTSRKKFMVQLWGVPKLRALVTGFEPRESTFDAGSVHFGFAADKVVLKHGFFFPSGSPLSPARIIPLTLSRPFVYHPVHGQTIKQRPHCNIPILTTPEK
jgi:hypothetical protein